MGSGARAEVSRRWRIRRQPLFVMLLYCTRTRLHQQATRMLLPHIVSAIDNTQGDKIFSLQINFRLTQQEEVKI
jgi:hypothetical protein